MAYVLGFPRGVTERYETVRAGGGTPSARCVPKLTPLVSEPGESIWTIMEPGKLYMERIDYNGPGEWLRGDYERNGPVSMLILRLGEPRYVGRYGCWQPDFVLVRNFRDVVGANRIFD